MRKDTESLGNDKAPACESRGFVHKKKEGVYFDTPPFFYASTCGAMMIFPHRAFFVLSPYSLTSLLYI